MKYNKLIRFAAAFESLASKEELPKDSKDLSVILKNIENLETYSARKKYAERNLKHLSSGSSRIIYLTPQKTIIKLAKNDKGIAQNKAESNPAMKSKFINKTIRKSKNFSWIETYYLDKINAKEFKKLTDLDFDDFGDSVRYGLRNNSGSKKEKPDNFEDVAKSEIYKEIVDIGKKFKLMGGDIARESSWGKKDGHPVLIDAGLTKEIFEEFYES